MYQAEETTVDVKYVANTVSITRDKNQRYFFIDETCTIGTETKNKNNLNSSLCYDGYLVVVQLSWIYDS